MDVEERAARLLAARDAGATLVPDPDLDLPAAYAIAAAAERRLTARGWTRVGRKVGFTNPATWSAHGLDRPIWAPVYDATLTRDEQVDVAALPGPRLEPEVVVGIGRDLRPGDPDPAGAVAWAALGVEIVASHHPGWRFSPADAVADFGVHARLVVGPAIPLGADPAAELAALVLDLEGPDGTVTTGTGRDVLGGPVEVLAALLDLPGAAPLRTGEVVTTGTLLAPPWLTPGQRWRLAVRGGPAMTLRT